MNIKIVAVGKLKEDFYREAEAEFLKRLSKYAKVTVVQIKDEGFITGQEQIALEAEGKRILDAIRERDYVIALAIEGIAYDSVSYADHIDKLMNSGVSDMVFVIGGSAGLHKSVLNRADELLSFSKFTFSHQLMRPILLEQIFRTFKIINRETYHK